METNIYYSPLYVAEVIRKATAYSTEENILPLCLVIGDEGSEPGIVFFSEDCRRYGCSPSDGRVVHLPDNYRPASESELDLFLSRMFSLTSVFENIKDKLSAELFVTLATEARYANA
jgi:hypothetical protein